MKIILALALALVVIGSSKDPGTRQDPQKNDPVSLESLGIRVLDGPRAGLVHGMMQSTSSPRRYVFYYRGELDGRAPLTAPIGDHKLDVKCADAACRELSFLVRWGDVALLEPVRARVFFPTLVVARKDTAIACPAGSTCARLHELLAAGIDVQRSNAVEASYRSRRYLSVTLVGPRGTGPLMHLSVTPGIGDGFLSYDWETGDGTTIPGFLAGGREKGSLTIDGDGKTQITLPGATIVLQRR